LRPRPQINNVETANEQITNDHDYELVGDFLHNNQGIIFLKNYENICCDFLLQFLRTYAEKIMFLICTGLHSGKQKRNGRKITTLNDIFSRTADMPKIKIIVNEYGQPVGENYRKFASAIGCQVRKTIPVRFKDWRLVPMQ
jgi:hypothetical protein